MSSAMTPAPAAASRSSGAAAGSTSGGSAASPSLTTIPCTPPSGGSHVVYRARLRWKGTLAEVFAIEPGRRLVIMDRARCQVLVDRSF